MTKQEYQDKYNEILKNKKLELSFLAKEYALSNNYIKVGDVFTDHIGSIKVETIRVEQPLYGLPSCIYFGLQLKKDLTPFLNGVKRDAYQSNKI